MTIRFLTALLLALAAAPPAWAQADKFDSGDWWWIDTTGRGPGEEAILSNGEGVRRGDTVELDMFMIFRKPDGKNTIGVRVRDVVNCAAKTRANGVLAVIYADGRIVELPNPRVEERGAIDPQTTLYRFACTGERSLATHYGKGSRRQVVESLFAKYPGN